MVFYSARELQIPYGEPSKAVAKDCKSNERQVQEHKEQAETTDSCPCRVTCSIYALIFLCASFFAGLYTFNNDNFVILYV